MDRQSIRFYLIFGLVLSACTSSKKPPTMALAAATAATEPSVGMANAKKTSKSTLAYHVEFSGPYLLSVELGTRFELVVRGRPGESARTNKPRRIDLGKADYDILDLVADEDGNRAYVASTAGWVRGYRLSDGAQLSEWHMGSQATALALSHDGESLLIGTASGLLCLRRLRDGAQLQCLVAHDTRVSAIDSHGTTVASGSWDGGIALWTLPGLREEQRSHGKGYISALAFSNDGATLAVARNGRHPIRTPELNKAEKRSPNVDPVGHNAIELYRNTNLSRTPPTRLEGHRSVISALAWVGPDLISTSWDRTVQIWNTGTPSQVRTLLRFGHLASDVATSRLGGEVAIAGWATEEGASSVRWAQLLYRPLP